MKMLQEHRWLRLMVVSSPEDHVSQHVRHSNVEVILTFGRGREGESKPGIDAPNRFLENWCADRVCLVYDTQTECVEAGGIYTSLA